MKEIEKLIQFAINNQYQIGNVRPTKFEPYGVDNYNGIIFTSEPGWVYHKNLTVILTSKSFIDVIAKGLWKIRQDSLSIHFEYEDVEVGYKKEVREGISLAIYNNTLPDFINNLGIGNK